MGAGWRSVGGQSEGMTDKRCTEGERVTTGGKEWGVGVAEATHRHRRVKPLLEKRGFFWAGLFLDFLPPLGKRSLESVNETERSKI